MTKIPKDIMKEIVELRKKNIDLHERYCKYIIENVSFKSFEDWEKQRSIDILSGVQFGEDIAILDDTLQLGKNKIKDIFKEHGVEFDTEKSLWQQA